MEAKLSSMRIIAAADFATSVPVMPIATPMSACLRAGASFTPSPVIATTCPRACRAFTRRSFCSGATRAKTAVRSATSGRSSSEIFSRSRPDRASSVPFSPHPFRPICKATARAVTRWSPVIIFTAMPACWHLRTESIASGRGGSIMPCRPRNVSPSATCSCSSLSWSAAIRRRAKAITRSPRAAIASAARCTASLSRMAGEPSSASTSVHLSSRRSSAPTL